jgi:hypothetical protein
MTVLSRGGRARRGGRRPGWVLLTALLVLAIGASSALVFTDRVELLKLAVILALWAAVAGAFVSVLYRRQSDADRSRVRDLKLVYDLQLDREISARREYELAVESQLRRELASELRAQAADDVAVLRAELAALRTSLEILFDTDLEQRPALETLESEPIPGRAYTDWARNGEGGPVDWVASDRPTSVRQDNPAPTRPDEAAIIDVPEEPLLPPRQPPPAPEPIRYETRYEAPFVASPAAAPPRAPEPRFEPRQRPPPPTPDPDPAPVAPPPPPQWLPPGPPPPVTSGRRRRDRQRSSPDEPVDGPVDREQPTEPPPSHGESGRRSRSRHSAEYRDYGVSNFAAPPPAPAPEPDTAPPPRLAPAPPPEPTPRHSGGESTDGSHARAADTGGQSVADLMARLRIEPSGGGRRRRRDG